MELGTFIAVYLVGGGGECPVIDTAEMRQRLDAALIDPSRVVDLVSAMDGEVIRLRASEIQGYCTSSPASRERSRQWRIERDTEEGFDEAEDGEEWKHG